MLRILETRILRRQSRQYVIASSFGHLNVAMPVNHGFERPPDLLLDKSRINLSSLLQPESRTQRTSLSLPFNSAQTLPQVTE